MNALAKKRVSGNEKISNLQELKKSAQKLSGETWKATGNKALTKAEHKRIEKRLLEIDRIVNNREKQIKKTHKVKPW